MLKFRSSLAAALLVFTAAPVAAQSLEAAGAPALGVELRRLATTKRVLMVGAHPDDENTALIAELALGDGASVAYLSLTRGEGGQNLIGPELQEGLGLIRSGELLAARRLDGARQFFTRAYDYGFSKSADEAFRQWPRDTILADVVEVIRRYRPDIIVSIFSGTPADGHGQHQAAGILAQLAFDAARDSMRFPEQLARGLRPHAAAYLFQAMYQPPRNPPITVATGDIDPLFGRSRFQIAMQSRSRHRSQDMGQSEPLDPQFAALRVLAGDYPAGGRSLFAGLDTTLLQRARSRGAPAGAVQALAAADSLALHVLATFNPLRPSALLRDLRLVRAHLETARASLTRTPRAADLDEMIAVAADEVARAYAQAAGIMVAVTADTPAPVAGDSFTVSVAVRGAVEPATRLRLPAGWRYTAAAQTIISGEAGDQVTRSTFRVRVPDDARTEPYFLTAPRTGAFYLWPAADSLRTLPFEPPAVRTEITIADDMTIQREAEFVAVDKALGEIRRPLLILPRASIHVAPDMLVMRSADRSPHRVSVTVKTAAASGVAGELRLDVPRGWTAVPAAHSIRLESAGETRSVDFSVTPPADVAGEYELSASFHTARSTYTDGYTLIDYPHIRARPLYRPATVRVSAFPVAIAAGLRIGFIAGAGDDAAAALTQLGATVEELDADALARGDLSRYDAIVTGIRAYEVRPDLLLHNDRLLAYTRSGGTFIVQYNKYEIVAGGYMPFPATMARPHGRVTDETAAVELLQPGHPILSQPNRITAADFNGWVQERGLYFLDTFDPRYTPLLSMADPGEAAQHGSLVVTRVGSGWYVYTGLALFRQIPAGVSGAYRLLANLVSLGSTAP